MEGEGNSNFGACRDDMKFYVRDLLTRLKIGDCKMKSQALIALNEVLSEDENYVRIIIETSEIISLLMNFLEFLEIEIQEESVKAISVVVGFDSCRVAPNPSQSTPLLRRRRHHLYWNKQHHQLISTFLDQLLYFLRNGEASVLELALKLTLRLSEKTEKKKSTFVKRNNRKIGVPWRRNRHTRGEER
ncbi:hypothetical protein NE237_023292 [Protea cynaroides]|uniref:Uncharacterized protein n=1 Tax=Protea cynaroides TaxID=273540 RepID=A0A9Q0HEN1_9MAGN|nr:hypothetical protein NE237_023292 [Protea cynaroides]